jgi:hypothetical protein
MTTTVQACQYTWCRGHEISGVGEHISKAHTTVINAPEGIVSGYAVVDTNDRQDNEIYVYVQSPFDGDTGTCAFLTDSQGLELRDLIDTAIANGAQIRGNHSD